MTAEADPAYAQSNLDLYDPLYLSASTMLNQDFDYQDQHYLQLPGVANDRSLLFGPSLIGGLSAESFTEALLPSSTIATSLMQYQGAKLATTKTVCSESTNSNIGEDSVSYIQTQEEQNTESVVEQEDNHV